VVFYCSPGINKVMKPSRIRRGDEKYLQNIIGKPEGKSLLGRSRRILLDNIKMYLKGMGCDVD